MKKDKIKLTPRQKAKKYMIWNIVPMIIMVIGNLYPDTVKPVVSNIIAIWYFILVLHMCIVVVLLINLKPPKDSFRFKTIEDFRENHHFHPHHLFEFVWFLIAWRLDYITLMVYLIIHAVFCFTIIYQSHLARKYKRSLDEHQS